MSGDTLAAVSGIYVGFGLSYLLLASMEWSAPLASHGLSDRQRARLVLLAPMWPLPVLWLAGRASARFWLAFGRLLRDAVSR